MPRTKQINNALPTIQQSQEKEQTILFFKSYLRYLKKIIECSNALNQTQSSIFDLKKTSGNISLELFLQRILSYFKCGQEAFICALCFIDRLANSQTAKTEKISLSIKNIFKIISVALLVSTKNFDDFYYTNNYYARVCGMSLQQLNTLQKQFLRIIDFDVFIDSEQYQGYESVINSHKKAYAAEMQTVGKENLVDKINKRRKESRINFQNSQTDDQTNIEVEVVA